MSKTETVRRGEMEKLRVEERDRVRKEIERERKGRGVRQWEKRGRDSEKRWRDSENRVREKDRREGEQNERKQRET